ncbi:c-type cytochrome [Flavihumibacter solisilvae]|uniref:Cytochrome c class I n=1 Tax=Flavihumibacter solisilvae TaxID=1349421 RepID=A0A0C1LBT1_9BACT|nr:c-type cytochrome [Flavihumibacter solisilvae]KIC92978.1 cytochrome c class I [Flavihumibacter solisilvae]
MKKFFIVLGVSAIAIACGNNQTTEKKADEPAAKEEQAAPAPAEDDKGVELIASSDCLTCHKVNEKAIGPSYSDVAKKYTADDATITDLANKIIKGGSGVWGQVPMTPHPQVSEDDAKTMVKYILTLKNQ